jgi:hypothetical protein
MMYPQGVCLIKKTQQTYKFLLKNKSLLKIKIYNTGVLFCSVLDINYCRVFTLKLLRVCETNYICVSCEKTNYIRM